MKAFIAAIFIMLFGFSGTAYADGTPHVKVEGEVWLTDTAGVRLFLLPEGYYVRINNLDESFYYLTFNGVSGKVDKTTVVTVGYHAEAPGTKKEIAISDDFGEFSAINLKSKPDITSESVAEVPIDGTITFIGEYPAEELWYYVSYGDVYGYIRADRTSMPTPDYPVFVPEPEPDAPASTTPEGTSEPEGEESTLLKIVLIAALVIPAIALIVFLFKRNRRYRYERYDYRNEKYPVRRERSVMREDDYRNEDYRPSRYDDGERYTNSDDN